jgi:hypothetical protein
MTTLNFAPDHPVTIRLKDKSSGRVVHEETTPAELLGGLLLRVRITWNALAVSGGSRWVHPATHEHFARGLTVDAVTTRPDTGEEVEIDLHAML